MDTLLGHGSILTFLERTAKSRRFAHAYLFAGREGIGKKLVAIRFACFINCPDPENDHEGTCPVCRRIQNGNHPDITIEQPERGMIRIDMIRQLQGFFRYAPVEAQCRVVLIDDAHTMNHQAQNALLKTLEEPPSGRLLILISSNPSRLLPTVRSRVRKLRFGPIPSEELAVFLEERTGHEGNKARALAGLACGSPGRALEIEKSGYLDLREGVISALFNPGQGGAKGILDLSETISADKKTALSAIEIASAWIRDVLLTQAQSNSGEVIHGDFLDRIASAAQHQSGEALLAAYNELAGALSLLEAETNINPKLVTDVMLLRMSRALAGPSMGVATSEP
jgi:DNA polymerase III subunit delta'